MLDELRATSGLLLERWGCELEELNGEPDQPTCCCGP